MSRGRTSRRRVTVCRECHRKIEATAIGRPRVVCGANCASTRARRRERELFESDVGDSRAWWLSLTHGQRCTAILWGMHNPTPPWFKPRRAIQLWCYYNRAAFSCEGRVAAVAL
jgi:hypothetical protein